MTLTDEATTNGTAPRQQIESFYDSFAVTVGIRDYLMPNVRHHAVAAIFHRRLGTGLKILDVGCGAGQLTRHLTRHGQVTACDISAPAIRFAQLTVPNATFQPGRVEHIDGDYDTVTCFDVFEHIPRSEREAFLRALKRHLQPGGRMLFTTPHPSFTRSELERGSDLLQVVDELVDVAEVIQLASRLGLELQNFETYDLGRAGCYQFFELAEPHEWLGKVHPWSRSERVARQAGRLVRRSFGLPRLLSNLRGSHASGAEA